MRILSSLVAGLGCICISVVQAANLGAAGATARSGPTAAVATGAPSPNLVFSFVSVQKTTYPVSASPRSVVVYDFQRDADACKQPYSFPLQLIVKNLGPDYTPQRDVPQNAAAAILPYWVNNQVDLKALQKGESQVMNFTVTLPPGQYTLWARILDKVALNWPLEVKCDTKGMAPLLRPSAGAVVPSGNRALAPAPIPAPVSNDVFGSKRPVTPTTTNPLQGEMTPKRTIGSTSQPMSLDELKLRLSKMKGSKVVTSARIKNRSVSSSTAARFGTASKALPASGGAALGVGAKTMSQTGTGQGASAPNASTTAPSDPRATSKAPNKNARMNDACSNYKGVSPILTGINGQDPNGFVFTPEHSVYTLTGCQLGDSGKLFLKGAFNSKTDSVPLIPLGPGDWQEEKIVARLDPGLSGVFDVDQVVIALNHTQYDYPLSHIQGFSTSFHARRTGPTLVTSVPQSLVTIFPEGNPTYMSPVANLYGLNGSLEVFRLGLTNSVLKGQDKISLKLKPGFVVDSVQIQYLIYSGDGSTSVSTADSSSLPVIQGNDILINWPINSVAQSGQSQPVFYSVYALSIWVDGPVGFQSPWADDPN